MNILIEVLQQLRLLFLHPMLYFGILLIILQYQKQITLERKLFSSKIHILPLEVIRSLSYGLIGGIIASILMILLGIVFHPTDMWLIWLITGILILFHVRFLCLSYSVGIVGFIAAIIQIFDQQIMGFVANSYISWLEPLINILVGIHIPSLIAIVAILHFVEAILIKLQASKQATPLFVESKRGKLVGGYHIQSFWILPIFLLVSTGGSAESITLSFSWWPLIGGTNAALSIIPVPAMIGYSDLTTVYSPKEKSNKAYLHLFIYSIILFILAFVANTWVYFELVAVVFSAFGHEAIRFLSVKKEEKLPPKYVHPSDGLKVLAVLPGSIAEKMGIKEGEIIKKVNGFPITNRVELYKALQTQSAFVKVEIENKDGHLKFGQHSIYTGDHHQLGIILSPDESADFYIEVNHINIFDLIKQKVNKIKRGA